MSAVCAYLRQLWIALIHKPTPLWVNLAVFTGVTLVLIEAICLRHVIGTAVALPLVGIMGHAVYAQLRDRRRARKSQS